MIKEKEEMEIIFIKVSSVFFTIVFFLHKIIIQFFDIFVMLFITTLGSIAKYMLNVKNKKEKNNFFNFITHIVVSAFAGLLTYYMCKYYNVNTDMTSMLAGISGYSSIEVINLITNKIKLLSKINFKDNNNNN